MDRITNPAGDYLSYAFDNNANLTEESIFSSQGTRTRYKGYNYGDPANDFDLSPGKPWKAIVRNQDNTADLETVYQYSHGNVSQITDPANGQTSFSYDTLNRLTKTIEQQSDTRNAVTSYDYDARNNLVSITDANGNQTLYTYDDRGLLVKQISPDTGTTTFAYNETGSLLSKTLNDGRTTEYTYDILGRLTSIMFDDNTQDVIYLYDQNINGKGRLTGISDASGNYAFSYDALGNLTTLVKTIENTTFTTSYTYDGAGNITSITYPDDRTVNYEYSSSGYVNRITTTKNGTTQVLADTISYLPFGPVQTLEFGNSELLEKTFDLQYRPDTLTLQDILELSYGYDPAGNITSIIDILDNTKDKTFSYDKAHRLISSTGSSGSFNYIYDLSGNRLTRTKDTDTQTYDYVSGTNKLSSITDLQSIINLSYDNNGNITAKGAQTFVYNQNNRLIHALDDSTTLGTYVYNSFGQRVKKTANDQTTLFHYDLNGNLIAESDAEGNVLKAYVYLGSQRIAVIESSQNQNFTVQVQTDAGRSLEGVKVYVFNENDSYAGIFATTNEAGQAIFENSLFIAETYKFRADYLNDHFWSGPVLISSGTTFIEIQEVSQPVKIIQNNGPLEGIKVYVFDENGSYLGLNSVTDATGTVWFDLPVGHEYKFRADIMGSQFFSDIIMISSADVITIDSQGGVLNFSLTKGEAIPISNVKTYLFSDAGQYLGRYNTTDSSGSTSYEVPTGTYKIRCDYLGYQFWTSDIAVTANTSASLEIPHQEVTITVNQQYQAAIEPVQNAKAYLFTESGSYQGIQATTDSQGQVIFNLPEKAFKVRTDHYSQQYWSNTFTWTDETITIARGMATLSVSNMGTPLPDVKIYVFDSLGSYLGTYETTDANGNVSFILPQGSYQFRADWMNNQYWTSVTQISANEETPVILSTGGGTIALTIKKDADTILERIKCYLFNSTGSYLGEYRTTDSSGQISFSLGDGQYKIRADYMGYQFWTSQFTIPGELTLELMIPHEQVTISVNRNYNSDIEPCDGIKAYLFTESGSYQGIYETTDINGTITFDIPEKAYKVRADYMSKQYWSDVFTWTDQTITIEQGQAQIEVRQNTTLLEGIKVYVFNDQGQYQGIYGQTGANGLINFELPQDTYKFRADYLGSQYWATQSITAHESTPVTIDTQGAAFSLTIEKQADQPIEGIRVYAFSSSGSYLGLYEQTNETGSVTFDLPDGDYKFRADYFGYQFWTDTLNIPGTSSLVLTIPHQDVVIFVNSQYTAPEPIQGVKIYLFTAAGSYQGRYGTTGSDGTVTFNVPEKAYKVRADYMSNQYWSEPFTGIDTAITIDHAIANLHVTMAGADIAGARVYLFSESGSYLSKFDNTDEQGKAEFFLPVNTYKFRVDHNSTQYWSDPVSLVAFQENSIGLNLDLLALNLTSDPYYGRYDGMAPEKEKILLASTGSEILGGVGGTGSHTVYYFINDHLGTPLKIMDSQGQIVWSADYTPFGQALVSENAIGNEFRLPGQYYDSETGLHYNWHRYYDPDTGKYLTPDPIGLAGGINPFVYSYNNPINFIDPNGLDWISTSLGISSFAVNTGAIILPVLKPFGLVISGASAGYAVYQYSIDEISKSEMTITISSAAADLIGASSIKALSSAGKITAKEVVEATVGSVTRGVNTPLTIVDALNSGTKKTKSDAPCQE